MELTELNTRVTKVRKDIKKCSDLLDEFDRSLARSEEILSEIAAIKPAVRVSVV